MYSILNIEKGGLADVTGGGLGTDKFPFTTFEEFLRHMHK